MSVEDVKAQLRGANTHTEVVLQLRRQIEAGVDFLNSELDGMLFFLDVIAKRLATVGHSKGGDIGVLPVATMHERATSALGAYSAAAEGAGHPYATSAQAAAGMMVNGDSHSKGSETVLAGVAGCQDTANTLAASAEALVSAVRAFKSQLQSEIVDGAGNVAVSGMLAIEQANNYITEVM